MPRKQEITISTLFFTNVPNYHSNLFPHIFLSVSLSLTLFLSRFLVFFFVVPLVFLFSFPCSFPFFLHLMSCHGWRPWVVPAGMSHLISLIVFLNCHGKCIKCPLRHSRNQICDMSISMLFSKKREYQDNFFDGFGKFVVFALADFCSTAQKFSKS